MDRADSDRRLSLRHGRLAVPQDVVRGGRGRHHGAGVPTKPPRRRRRASRAPLGGRAGVVGGSRLTAASHARSSDVAVYMGAGPFGSNRPARVWGLARMYPAGGANLDMDALVVIRGTAAKDGSRMLPSASRSICIAFTRVARLFARRAAAPRAWRAWRAAPGSSARTCDRRPPRALRIRETWAPTRLAWGGCSRRAGFRRPPPWACSPAPGACEASACVRVAVLLRSEVREGARGLDGATPWTRALGKEKCPKRRLEARRIFSGLRGLGRTLACRLLSRTCTRCRASWARPVRCARAASSECCSARSASRGCLGGDPVVRRDLHNS